MQLQFQKNIQFTKLIKADGRLREFNFRKMGGIQDGLFTLDVSDEKGNRLMLRLHKEDGIWKVMEPENVPLWILRNEKIFHDVIEEELASNP
ncbi:MAG: hypothetical protein IPP79_16175 [Chitinophagaceae bacterium]|nr:hypothetical protein [Chitinophagaceae bacterium]